MYNSKRFETVKNMRENKKISNAVQAAIGVLAVVLAALIVWMMVLVSGIQGTARVVNYAGLVRGETQRLVKMEIAGQAEDEMMESVESFINGLRFGDDELTLVRLDDKSFQTKMEELASCFESLKQEIYLVREKGFEKTDIIDKSEKFFDVCDDATGLAETYSQKRASSLAVLERYITADIVVLMMLIGYEFIKALHYTAMNHALQKKVYMDEATGLPNKNKCEELLSAPKMITMPVGVCSFDLNNLRRINNSMGHEKGDAYIRIFAELVREAVPAHYFVGRAGGDEFIAIMDGADKEEMQRCLQLIRDRVDTYNAANPDFPVSYAVGISVSDENENCTMRDLYILADKNMYINKNHVKREEALAEKKLDRRLLKSMKKYGSNFSDCLYCDARQDAYRVIRASEAFFLAADGQCMMIVEQGRVVELCAEPGEFTYDASSEPSVFSGSLSAGIKNTFAQIGKRFTYGGDAGKDQRVYYFNTKELIDNKFGTPNPIPFRVVDNKIGLDVDVSVRCSGVYSYRIADPLLFYTNVCGNVEQEYTRDELDSQLKHEFISALQPAFGKLSDLGLRPNQIVAHNTELEDAMNTALSAKWGELRGLTVVSIALGSVTLPDEDAEMIKQAQRTAMMRDPTMAAATLVGAQSDAMKTAAGNSAGAMNGFMGVNMAMNAGGMNAQALYGMGQQQAAQAADSWKCACGTVVNGNFCPNCGAKKPDNDGWTCSCGKVNKGNFCANCGAKKPEGLPKYRCDKCGWEPEDPAHPPKFCPQCGDPFDENDRA